MTTPDTPTIQSPQAAVLNEEQFELAIVHAKSARQLTYRMDAGPAQNVMLALLHQFDLTLASHRAQTDIIAKRDERIAALEEALRSTRAYETEDGHGTISGVWSTPPAGRVVATATFNWNPALDADADDDLVWLREQLGEDASG